MDVLNDVTEYIEDFNKEFNIEFAIDSIRVKFSKQHKIEKLRSIGKWIKIHEKSVQFKRLQKRITNDEITSAYQLKGQNIYYYNIKDLSTKNKKYRSAQMVIFGITQYNTEVPSQELIRRILLILNNISNIDICLDLPYKPKYEQLEKIYSLTPCVIAYGVVTSTIYINEPNIPMIEKIVIYNKALKNSLKYPLWRIEATIIIPNIRYLALPLYELKELTDLTK